MPITSLIAPLVLALVPLLPPAPDVRFTNTAILVIDASGSMKPSVKKCLQAFSAVTRQSTDDYRIKVLVWAERSAWFSDKWTRLPDAIALAEAEAWIAKKDVGDSTYLAQALRTAVSKAPKKCTVIVLSDFECYFEMRGAVGRVVKSRPDIVWAAIQIRNEKIRPHAKVVGEDSGGVYFWR